VRRSFARRAVPTNVALVEPIPYALFVAALERCDLVLTDSGGVLEEATVLGKPVLIARERTERPEAVDAGIARVVGTERGAIEAAAAEAITELGAATPPAPLGIFGDGRAGVRTVEWLRWRYGLRPDRPAPFVARPPATRSKR